MPRTPLLIHSMGKVGSKTIEHACKRLECFDVFHTHALSRMVLEECCRQHDKLKPHMRNGLRVRREVLETGHPFKLVSATRDPLARNVSAFFQNLETYGFGKREIDAANGIVAALVSRYPRLSAFLRSLGISRLVDPVNDMVAMFMRNFPHSEPAYWFDAEIRDVIGIDLLAEPFDPEVGYATYAIGASSVLVLQVELPDARKEAVLRDFLQTPSLRLEQSNVGSQKGYAKAYRRFRAGIEFATEFLDEIYGSRYARHFYSAQQLEGFRARWRVRGAGSVSAVTMPVSQGASAAR